MLHAVAPAYVNSMQQPQAQVHAVTSAQYVPPPVPSAQYMAPAYYAADGVQATPGARGQVERGQVVQVGQLMHAEGLGATVFLYNRFPLNPRQTHPSNP